MDFATWDSLGNIPPSGVDGIDSGGFAYWDTMGNMPAWTVADAPPVYTVTPVGSVVNIYSGAATVTYVEPTNDSAAARRRKRRLWYAAMKRRFR